MSFPKVILVDNATYCNLRCSMCDYKNFIRKKQMMPINLYRKIIDEVACVAPSTRIWEIFIGDPCCCPDMHTRIEYAKSVGLTDIVLNTNGNALYAKRSEEFIKSGLDGMYVGVDARTQETYSKLRIGGTLKKVISNVLTYRDLLYKFGRKDQKLFVQFLYCDENKDEKNSFISFWKKEGINIKLRTRVSWAGLVDSPNLRSDIVRVPCKWGMDNMVICADGSVALCPVDAHCAVNCGDINFKTLMEVWNGILLQYRGYHVAGEFDKLPIFCKNCNDWQAGMCEYNP